MKGASFILRAKLYFIKYLNWFVINILNLIIKNLKILEKSRFVRFFNNTGHFFAKNAILTNEFLIDRFR